MRLAKFFGAGLVVLCTSGTVALWSGDAAATRSGDAAATRSGDAAAAGTISFAGSPAQLSRVHYSQTTAILQELTNAKSTANSERVSRWLDQLGTIYAGMTGGAIWTDAHGYTARARAIIEEMGRADDWGLKASDHVVASYRRDALATGTLAKMEVGLSLAIIKYVWHARGGRIEPTELSLWLDRKIAPVDAIATIKAVATAADPQVQLRLAHPQHPQFERLRQAYLKLRYPERFKKSSPEDIRVPVRGPRLRPGVKHRDIAIIRLRLGVLAIRRDVEVYDRELVAAVNAYMRKQGWKRKRIIDASVRKALNNPKGRARRLSTADRMALLMVNMEKWRWMPENLGSLYVWNNLPAYRTRVMKDGAAIHSERIIIGKIDSQTPVFSDEMTHVVFKPQWGIPNSIKIRSLLPRLASGDYGVLARRGMAIKYDNGVVKDPSRINWSRTDIRSVPIVMGPGSSNPLGRVKFIFPNHHSVYMHDTPNRGLFASKKRNFSHGCIRVRNPVRLAEIIMSESSGWDSELVARQMKRRAPGNNRVPLPNAIPVHNTYFTVIEDEASGRLARLNDVYGHDKRILAALNGKPAALIAKADPARAQLRKNERLATSPAAYTRVTRRRTQPDGAMALGAGGFYALPPPTTSLWGKPKKQRIKAKAKSKRGRSRRRAYRRRAIPVNPFRVYY